MQSKGKLIQVLLDYLREIPVGSLVTWVDLEAASGHDVKRSGRVALKLANEQLEREYGRKLSLPEARGFVMLDAGTDTTERMYDMSPLYIDRSSRTEEGDALQELSQDVDEPE